MSVKREDLKYCANYCEENVWHLAEDSRLGPGDRFAVLLTSPAKSVPVWKQKAAPGEDDPVFWDYHVILIVKNGPGSTVYDFDSDLPFPANFDHYVRDSFMPVKKLPYNYHPRFRVIPARDYRATFSSDRAHMKLKDGTWRSPPPQWNAIQAPNGTTLKQLLDLRKPTPGQLLDLEGLIQMFGARAAV